MRSYVFTDPELVKQASALVWLDMDAEKAVNAGFLEKFPVGAFPTLMVLDPTIEKVALLWPGSATAKQLARLLDDGARAVNGIGDPAADANATADGELVRADRLYAALEPARAADAYLGVLASAPLDWPGRPRAVESAIAALSDAKQPKECADVAVGLAPGLPRGPSFANAVALGLYCALGEDPKTPWRAPTLALLEPLAREALALPGLLADDRSGLYELVATCSSARHDPDAEKKTVLEWLAFLDAEAGKAPNPEARAAFDAHLLSAALRAGDPSRALEALLRSERDLPADYNAPARLALLYKELGRFDDALAATNRALAKVYGPRRIRILETRTAILLAKGDAPGARRTLGEAIAFARALPAGQRSERTVKRLEAALEKLP